MVNSDNIYYDHTNEVDDNGWTKIINYKNKLYI